MSRTLSSCIRPMGLATATPTPSSGQRGAALVIVMVMLLLLTLLGLQAMRGTLMQERMASNMNERNQAFQLAEAALRQGETWTLANSALAQANVPLDDPFDWDGSQPEPTGEVLTLDPSLPDPPMFHVGPPQYIRVGVSLPPQWQYFYPVTARASGRTQAAVVVVQSSFEPPQ